MYNFLTIFSLGCLHNDKIECSFRTRSFSFQNSKFYSYKLCIAYFVDNQLHINRYSVKYGGDSISHTTSRQISKLVELCEKFDIPYSFVPYEDTIEELLVVEELLTEVN